MRDQIRELIATNGSMKQAQETVGQAEIKQWQLADEHHARTVIRAFTELEWE